MDTSETKGGGQIGEVNSASQLASEIVPRGFDNRGCDDADTEKARYVGGRIIENLLGGCLQGNMVEDQGFAALAALDRSRANTQNEGIEYDNLKNVDGRIVENHLGGSLQISCG